MGTYFPETCREVEINILRSSVHPVGLIWKRLYRDAGQQVIKFSTAKDLNMIFRIIFNSIHFNSMSIY